MLKFVDNIGSENVPVKIYSFYLSGLQVTGTPTRDAPGDSKRRPLQPGWEALHPELRGHGHDQEDDS